MDLTQLGGILMKEYFPRYLDSIIEERLDMIGAIKMVWKNYNSQEICKKRVAIARP